MRYRLRHAAEEDAIAIADLFFASYRLLTFLPMLHTIEEYRWFVAAVMLTECAVTVAEDGYRALSRFSRSRAKRCGNFARARIASAAERELS